MDTISIEGRFAFIAITITLGIIFYIGIANTIRKK